MSLLREVQALLEQQGVPYALIGAGVLEAAERLSLVDVSLPVARPEGLILLKLHAGGPKDAWDILALLEASSDTPAIRPSVEEVLPRLPANARRLWSRLEGERSI